MKANPVFSLYIPTKLVFGCGEIKKLSSEKLPGKKALVVISSGTSMRKYGYLERVLAQLRLNNVETLVYDKILPNPIKEHVMEAAAIIRDDGRYFNRQLFVRPTGEVTAYDKRHLFSIGGEGGLFSAGTERVVVEYGGLRLLLLVCYDLRFPVWSRCRNDYDAIVYSASWPESRREVWRTLLRARAIENEAYVIGVNRVGADPSARYTGDSVIVDFMGRTAADAGDRETVIAATLDREALERFRTKFPAWRDADPFTLG